MKSRVAAWAEVILGYVLSPLSWWNDLFVNLPLAYLFAAPFSFISDTLYLPAFVLGYWLSNLAGVLLLHRGGKALIKRGKQAPPSWKASLITATLYTALIVILVLTGILPSASELSQRIG